MDAAEPTPTDGGRTSPDGGADAALSADGSAIDALETAPVPPAAAEGRPQSSLGAITPRVTIRGQVFELGSRRQLPYAEVWVDDVAVASTGPDGRFELTIPAGARRLRVTALGYSSADSLVASIDAAATQILRLPRLSESTTYETVIRTERRQAPAVSLGREEVSRVPGSLGDPFRAIETLPGVSTIAWPLPIYAIRGTNPGNTGYFLDEVRVPALFHFALGPALIHPYLIDSLDFYPGGYPARYGRYVGGTVSAATHGPPGDMAHLSIDARLYDVGLLVSAPFDNGRGTVSLSGRYSYTATQAALFSSDIDVSYSDAQLRVEHPLGAGRITALAFASTDALDSTSPTNTRDHLHMRFVRASMRYTRSLGPGRIGLSVGGGLDSSRAPFDDDILSNALSVVSRSTQERLWYRAEIGPSVNIEAGIDGEAMRYDASLSQPNPALGDLSRPRTALLCAPYAALTLRLGSRLTLIPAFRQDIYREGGSTASSPGPRLSATLRLAERLSLNAAVGHYSQLPSLPVQVSGFENFGLGQYGLQTAWQSSFGVQAKLPFDIEFGATTYLQRSVLTDIRDPNSGDYLLDDYLVRRQALSYGEEILLRRPLGARVYGWVSYTLSRSLRLFEGGNVGPSSWDQTHVANLVVSYRLGAWLLGARAHLNTGRPVTIALTYPAEATRLPTYYQLDLRAERPMTFARFKMALYVEMLNATLSRQVTGINQDPGGRQESGYRIAVPSIGLRADL